jgi:hypothetical protein
MGTGYTRTNTSDIQADEVVKSAPLNAELNAVVNAFASSTGHSHDGTSAEGGPITKLLGTTITIGDGTAGTDITVNFDGQDNDGQLLWMEDEDYFQFNDDILLNSDEKIQFRDSGLYISSNDDGDLDIVSDGTAVDSINIESAGGITLDAGTAGSGIIYEDDGTEMLRIYNDSSNVRIESKVSDKDILIRGNDGGSAVTAVTFDMSAAGLATFGGGITSTSVANTLGATSFNDANITNVGNIALDSITADGSSITITGNTTFADGAYDFDIASHDTSNGLKLGGTLVTATAAELNILDGVTSTASELNILDGVTSTTAELNILDGVTSSTAELNYVDITTLGTSQASKAVTVDSNGDLIIPDSDKFKFGAGSDMQLYHDGSNSFITNATGTLKLATETSGIAVTIGHTTSEVTIADNLTVTGTTTLDATSFGDANITNVGDIALDSISADGTDINVAITDNSATSFTIKQGSDAYLIVDTGNSSESISIGTGISGTAITIGHGTSEVTIGDNLTVSGNLTVTGTQTVVDTVTMNAANAIVFEGATADANETTLTITDPDADRTIKLPNQSGTLVVLAADSDTAVTATPAELNIMDGGTSATSTTVVDADRVVFNDAGTMKQVAVTDLAAYFDDEITAMPNLVTTAATTVGALNSGSITTGFGAIDNGASNITTGGLLKIDVDADADDLTGDSSTGRITLGAGEDLNLYHGGTNSYIVNDTGDLILDTADDIVLDADGGDVFLKDAGTQYAALTNTSGNLILKSGSTTALTFSGANVTMAGNIDGSAGTVTFGSISDGSITATAFVDEDNMASNSATLIPTQQSVKAYVDSVAGAANNVTGLTATGTELNAVADGDTSASSITVEDADRIPINDGGTMKQIAVTTLAAYLDDEITAMPNLVTTAATTVGALDSGSITSGFGAIDNGTSGIRTNTVTVETSLLPDASGGADIGSSSAEFGDVYIADDKYINFGSDQNVLVGYDEDGDNSLEIRQNVEGADLAITFKADQGDDNADQWKLNFADGGTVTFQSKTSGSYATKQTLDTSGNLTITGELDAATLDISGDADIDGTLEADAITINGTAIGSIYGVVAGSSSIVTTGALDAGSISSGFGNIDVGSSNLTATGTISLGATSFNDNNITNVGNIALDSLTADGSSITITGNTTFADGAYDFDIASHDTSNGLKLGGTLVTATAAELNYVDGVTSNIQTQLNNAASTGKAIAMAMVFG